MGNLKALPQFYFTKTNEFIEEVQLSVFKEEPSYGKQLVRFEQLRWHTQRGL